MRVRFYANLQQIAGAQEAEIPIGSPVSVAEALRIVAGRYGPGMTRFLVSESGGIPATLMVVVNGSLLDRSRPATVGDGDEIALLLPLAGGSPGSPRLVLHVERCTGCALCALACSMHLHGCYNPRLSGLELLQGVSGLVTGIGFLEGCDRGIPRQCSAESPACAELCAQEALTVCDADS